MSARFLWHINSWMIKAIWHSVWIRVKDCNRCFLNLGIAKIDQTKFDVSLWADFFGLWQLNMKLLCQRVILIEICSAWHLTFWNPDTDRNLPWQHFIATSTDAIALLMPCHHSCFFNWQPRKMMKKTGLRLNLSHSDRPNVFPLSNICKKYQKRFSEP